MKFAAVVAALATIGITQVGCDAGAGAGGTDADARGGDADAAGTDADAGGDRAAGGADGGAGGAEGGAGDADAGGADAETDVAPDLAGDGGESGETAARPAVLLVATYLGGVSAFTIDPATGVPAAAPGSPFDMGARLYAVAVHPTRRFVYAVDLRGQLFAYRLNRDDGSLSKLAGSPMTIGGEPVSVAIDPDGQFLYVGKINEPSLDVLTIDASTGAVGAAHPAVAIAGDPEAMAFHPTGAFLYVSTSGTTATGTSGIRAYSLNRSTGVLTDISGSPFEKDLRGGGLAMHPTGKFLYNGAHGVTAFWVDGATGALSRVAGSPFPGANSDPSATDVAIDPQGRFLYATDFLGTIAGYLIDAPTGGLTSVPQSPFDGRPSPYSAAIDPTGHFLYVGNDDANKVSVFSVDRATGTLRVVEGAAVTANGLQPEMVVVPP